MEADLSPDCGACFGLCCAALPFGRSSAFAFDKEAGVACGHLDERFRCGIHDRLRDQGMAGCTVFECFGAGQHVSQRTYDGISWRQAPETAAEMYAVFGVVRQLQEVRVLLRQAAAVAPDPSIHELDAELGGLLDAEPGVLLALDLDRLRGTAGPLLGAASLAYRASEPGPDLSGADLIGVDLRGRDLSGADLRGALLIAADLRRMDLGRSDLLGADLRDADLEGADLSRVLYLTQPQLNAARGDSATILPTDLGRPAHW